jgi:CRP/FNR family transcriptional regulator, cyclic AMP receptor protein
VPQTASPARRLAPDLAALLREAAVLSTLSEPGLQALAHAAHWRRLARGEALFQQDDEARMVYVVTSGRVAIFLATADGRELVINEIGPGDIFGEMALLQGQKRSASAVARQVSEVVLIHGDAFLATLEQEPRLMRQLLGTLARRLRDSSEREGALAFLSAPARLARLLLEHAQAVDGGAPPDTACLVTTSQDELAQRVGVTRQTVAKILGGWRRAGWIITGRGKIMLVDRGALKRAGSAGQG